MMYYFVIHQYYSFMECSIQADSERVCKPIHLLLSYSMSVDAFFHLFTIFVTLEFSIGVI